MKPRRHWRAPQPLTAPSRNRHTASSALPLALLLIAGGMGLGYLHKRLQAAKKPDPVLSAAGGSILPFQKGVATAEAGMGGSFSALFRGGALQKENTALQERVAALELENSRLKDAAAQNERLKGELDYVSRQAQPPLAAEVLSWLPSPIKQTITIASRASAGVKTGSIVVTSKGLVGKVVEAEALRAQVQLLVDSDSRVAAMAVRRDKIVGKGVVIGQGCDMEGCNKGGRTKALSFEFLRPEDTLQKGDKVVTSGEGGVFPQGITIGWVEDVTQDAAHFSKTATVKPATPQPGDLREVLVLR
ncbi:MAG: rod shape-determining protein MreC [Armatimonas sp.]